MSFLLLLFWSLNYPSLFPLSLSITAILFRKKLRLMATVRYSVYIHWLLVRQTQRARARDLDEYRGHNRTYKQRQSLRRWFQNCVSPHPGVSWGTSQGAIGHQPAVSKTAQVGNRMKFSSPDRALACSFSMLQRACPLTLSLFTSLYSIRYSLQTQTWLLMTLLPITSRSCSLCLQWARCCETSKTVKCCF